MSRFDVHAYANTLLERSHEAVVVKRVSVAFEGWEAKANMCHHNVTDFCELCPAYTPVRGWLYFEIAGNERAKFLAHSVVRTPDGELIDITPWEATAHYPFLAGNLSDDEYAYLVDELTIAQLNPLKPAT